MDFSALPLSLPLQQVLAELGYRTLTPVQAESLPLLLAGRDLVGQSATGTGKTAAFSLPILQRIVLAPRRVQALVLCPTRELGAQVAAELRRLGRRLPGLQVLVVAGGQPVRPQIQALEKGAHVVVGTPGRVLDLLSRGALDTGSLATVVLDEADRMLDMGFRDDLTRILGAMPPARQTVLFSATFPPSILALSQQFQREPARVTIAQEHARPDIRQLAFTCEGHERSALLLRLLRAHRPASAIVFCNQKATVAELTRELRAGGVSAEGLQGDLDQLERDQALAKFRNRSTRVLVATDVAARGLDIESVDAVFAYDLPLTSEVHVHRSGRTGRAGRSGLAVLFATPRDVPRLEELGRATGATFEPGTAPAEDDPSPLEAPMVTLLIGAGRKDKLRPGDILGALTGEAGLAATDIGKIELHDRFAWVAVSRAVAATAFERLRTGRIKGRTLRVDRVR